MNFIRLVIPFSLLMALPATAASQDAAYVQAEGGLSVLSEWSVGEPSPGTAGYAVEGGYRWDSFGLGLLAEHNMWLVNQVPDRGPAFPDSVLNLGLQAEYTYFDDRLSSGLAAGTSTLLVDTAITRAGQTGVFAEIQPVAVRVPLTNRMLVEIEPLSYLIMAPVLDAIPLVESAFRTTVGLEVTL